jgi:biopolymer transport protein ExbD/uncharacterized protein YgiM (DUF1202 family)
LVDTGTFAKGTPEHKWTVQVQVQVQEQVQEVQVMFSRMRFVCAALALAVVTAGSQAQAAEQTFTGVINADQVNIRSGASTNHYPVMKLKRGATVVVHKAKVAGAKANQWDLYGWYQITPPAGSFSYVSKKFVTLDANGKTAVVSGNRVMVRAPAPTDPNASYKVQKSVNRGDKITVIGEVGDYYKIKPLPGIHLYVKKEMVTRATAGQLAALKNPATAGQPTTNATSTPATPAAKKMITIDILLDGSIKHDGKTHKADEAASALKAIAEANPNVTGVLLKPEGKADKATSDKVLALAQAAGLKNIKFVVSDIVVNKPKTDIQDNDLVAVEKKFAKQIQGDMTKIDETKLAGLADEYKQLLKKKNLLGFERRVIEARIGQLDGIAKAIAEHNSAVAIKSGLKQWDTKQPKTFVVTGVLRSSAVYTGQNMPLLYRIVEPGTPRTRAYVQPNSQVNLRALLGMRVGVVGTKRSNPTYRLQYIVPTSVEGWRVDASLIR